MSYVDVENDSNKDSQEPLADHNPATILASASEARTLSVSDQDATVLLTTDNGNGEKALLKLTVVPFHKKDLACPSVLATKDGEEKIINEGENETGANRHEQEEKEHSKKVLDFLSRYDWRCTSESGAEYSYHEAFPKCNDQHNNKHQEAKGPDPKRAKIHDKQTEATSPSPVTKAGVFKAELIYPASERQVARAMASSLGLSMIYETPQLYEAVTKPFIDKTVASGSLSWLQNVVEMKKEKERLLHYGNGWILNVDTKWRTHPDSLTVPRSEWYQHQSVIDLYCLCILKADGIASLRDLSGDHLPVLRDMQEQGPKVIEQVYGVKKDQLRIFVHYQPQFYHFHVHFTRLEVETGAQVERAHLLSDIIQNLEIDPNYYKKTTITYKLNVNNELYKLLCAYNDPDS